MNRAPVVTTRPDAARWPATVAVVLELEQERLARRHAFAQRWPAAAYVLFVMGLPFGKGL